MLNEKRRYKRKYEKYMDYLEKFFWKDIDCRDSADSYKEKVILIQVSSAGFEAGNYAKITINNYKVAVNKNENGHERGLHLVVINPESGQIEISRVFDTYKSSSELENFISEN